MLSRLTEWLPSDQPKFILVSAGVKSDGRVMAAKLLRDELSAHADKVVVCTTQDNLLTWSGVPGTTRGDINTFDGGASVFSLQSGLEAVDPDHRPRVVAVYDNCIPETKAGSFAFRMLPSWVTGRTEMTVIVITTPGSKVEKAMLEVGAGAHAVHAIKTTVIWMPDVAKSKRSQLRKHKVAVHLTMDARVFEDLPLQVDPLDAIVEATRERKSPHVALVYDPEEHNVFVCDSRTQATEIDARYIVAATATTTATPPPTPRYAEPAPSVSTIDRLSEQLADLDLDAMADRVEQGVRDVAEAISSSERLRELLARKPARRHR